MDIDIPVTTQVAELSTGDNVDGIDHSVSLDEAGSVTAALPPAPAPPSRYVPARTLRARQSLPAVQGRDVATGYSTTTTGSVRAATQKELDAIRRKLAPEATFTRRDELLKEKEAELRAVVDEHDTVVREKFHLERFITMITGWDPKLAKEDNAPVFLDYKRFNHNLFDHAPQGLAPSNAVAGPSRPRQSLPFRTTRRQAHDQTDIFSTPRTEAVVQPATPRGKGIVAETDGPERKKTAEVGPPSGEIAEEGKRLHGKGKLRAKVERQSMPPPAAPTRKKGRLSRLSPDGLTDEALVEGPGSKKLARASLPDPPNKRGPGRPSKASIVNLEPDPNGVSADVEATTFPAPPVKRGPGRPPKTRPLVVPSSPGVTVGDIEQTGDVGQTAASPPPPTPTPLPSLARVPFPPPPARPRQRRVGSSKIWYTDPLQRPHPNPPYQGDLSSLLTSYIHLEDAGPPPDLKSLELRAAREGFIRNRVNYLHSQGRLLRLLDEQVDDESSRPLAVTKYSYKPQTLARKQDHQDHLMSHMRQVRNAMLEEAKNRPIVCRRIARMIMAYWEHLQGKDAREQLEVERELKRRAKEIVRALKKRWSLAVKIIRAKMLEAQKAEQDRLGKEHLQNMLQRSTGLLEAQQTTGEEVEDDDENDSDGTDEVSSTEDSEVDEGAVVDGEADDDREVALDEAEEDGSGPQGVVEGGSSDAGTIGEADISSDAATEDGDEKGDEDGSSTDSAGHIEHGDLLDLLDSPERLASTDYVSAAEANLSAPASAEYDGAGPADFGATVAVTINGHLKPSDGLDHIPDSPFESGLLSQANGVQSHAAETFESAPIDSALQQPIRRPPADTLHRQKSHPSNGITNGPLAEHSTPNHPHIDSAHPPLRSRRARKVGPPPPIRLIEEVDPDADDVDFPGDSEADEQDQLMDAEMEDAESRADAGDSEDEGLVADADMPIEELLRRYGYEASALSNGDSQRDVSQPLVPADREDVIGKPERVDVDQSLVDANIGDGNSPLAISSGKRQRRARQVWTPEDNPPPLQKKPKIEEVTPESTPDLSSDEETDDEDEEEAAEIEDMEVEEDPNAPKTRPPFLLRGTLRPYQHAGLDWLAGLYANNMNGILADEMGLGKTIQTISLLGHLACDRGVWGQHLVIVPTSVILNWEMEFKKFLPGFKVLTYYGNQKERKEKRVGWLTEHSWQVCITSYQIVLADQHIFRRKNWVYMILDEAHNIKNFRSQRWQTLLGFKAQRRLLLTGTPLQNNLMELWSLLYFLMPHGVAEEATAVVGFANHKEFMEWFSNPMDKAVESGDVLDDFAVATVAKLHTLLRPFILRRLKAEVEKQLPGKFEHVVYCRLSKRQRFLYDEFMSRSSTKEALSSGGYMGVMNTLMQLRKVCNHPDLFEVRPVRTSFAMERSVVADFTPSDIIVRKRLLASRDEADIGALSLDIAAHEGMSSWTAYARRKLEASDLLPHAIEVKLKGRQPAPPKLDTQTADGWLKYRHWAEEQASIRRWRNLQDVNRLRCRSGPIYGSTLLSILSQLPQKYLPAGASRTKCDLIYDLTPPVAAMVLSFDERRRMAEPLVEKFAVVPPNATARDLAEYALPGLTAFSHPQLLDPDFDNLHHASTKLQIAFPDASLLQYDCGKLQKLAEMLRDLKSNGHRVLIFTQMTRVLDILEIFLNYNGHRYLRLDGSTKIEDRQIITERFNSDARIFCFIASSRSGGVGINLTGADTVFFYDSDWNPSMDRQCMDRAHRIGQTREVHIYRFVSSHTVEENMLKKANQKRLLDKVIIQEGDFTTEFFGRVDWRETLYDGEEKRKAAGEEEKDGVEDIPVEDEPEAEEVQKQAPRRGEEREFAKMVAEVEDEEDVQAARVALGEGEMDAGDFEAEGAMRRDGKKVVRLEEGDKAGTPTTPGTGLGGKDEAVIAEGEAGEDVDEDDDDVGAVDEYMLRLVEWDWNWFATYR